MKKGWRLPVLAAWIVVVLLGAEPGCSGAKQEAGGQTAAAATEPAPVAVAVATTGNKGKVQAVSPAASPAATPKKEEIDPALAVFPAKLPQGLKTVSVPGQVENALVAGAGRFLILELRALDKLAVFDVSEGKIAGFVALESRQDIFAAGAEKLIVVNRQSRMAKRYALAGLKLEATQPVPGSVPMMAVAMGRGRARADVRGVQRRRPSPDLRG